MPSLNCQGFWPRPSVIIAALMAATLSFYLTTTLHHDVSWYLIATDKLLEGAKLYRDIIEINPPLAFYLTIPPVAAARLTGLSPKFSFIIYVFLLIGASLRLTHRVLAARNSPSLYRLGILFSSLAALVLLPIGVFGQREHLMLILVLPYLLVLSARLGSDRLSPRTAIVIGGLASVGFGLKPHFLLVPILLEVYVSISSRSLFSWCRPEVWSLGVGVVLYGIVVLTVHPDYINIIVPYALLVYDAYSKPPEAVLLKPAVVIIVAALLIYSWHRYRGAASRRGDVFAIAAIAFLAAYAIQQKGWLYHLLPATLTTWFSLAAILLEPREDRQPPDLLWKMARSSVAGLLAWLLIIPLVNGPYRNQFADRLLPDVQKYAAGEAIYSFTSHVWVSFPLVNNAQVGWASRFPTQWLLPGALRQLSDPAALDPTTERQLHEIERYATDAVIEDLERMPPALVIVDKENPYFADLAFDYLDYFRHEPRFTRLWQTYVKIDEITIGGPAHGRQFEIWCRQGNSRACPG